MPARRPQRYSGRGLLPIEKECLGHGPRIDWVTALLPETHPTHPTVPNCKAQRQLVASEQALL